MTLILYLDFCIDSLNQIKNVTYTLKFLVNIINVISSSYNENNIGSFDFLISHTILHPCYLKIRFT